MRIAALIALIILMILIGGIAGYFIGANKFPQITGTTVSLSPSPESVSVTPFPSATISASLSPTPLVNVQTQSTEAVNGFYNWYLSCVNNHFSEKSQKSVADDCPYETNIYSSTQLVTNLANRSPTEYALFCSAEIPSSIKVDHVIVSTPTDATAYVIESFAKTQKQLLVDTKLESGRWKLQNITCPHT